MNVSQNRANEWVSPDLQPFVLSFLILIAVSRFIYVLWPKWKILKLAPYENRFNNPIKRIWTTIWIAIFQTKMFKETGAGWMHALIFWGFLIFLARAAWYFLIGIFPDVELDVGQLEVIYSLLKDVFIVFVTLATSYALFRRLVLKPERSNFIDGKHHYSHPHTRNNA